MSAWDDRTASAGGPEFGSALAALAAERDVSAEALARAANVTGEEYDEIVAGTKRVNVNTLARLAIALRAKPIEFMQRTNILSLEDYAYGLDPLYFLPEGQVRYDARIYMREINPRHRVPEADMTRRNPTLKAIAEDEMLAPLAKTELELTYLLNLAAQQLPG